MGEVYGEHRGRKRKINEGGERETKIGCEWGGF